MILKRAYDFNVVPGGPPLIIRVSRNDSSSQINLTLYAANGKLSIPGLAAFRAYVRGGTSGETACGCSSNSGLITVRVKLTKTMTGKCGRHPFEIVLRATDSGTTYTLVTASFILDIR